MLEQTRLNLAFLNRIVDKWNSLPFHVRSASRISSFKRGVINFLANFNCISRVRFMILYFLIATTDSGVPLSWLAVLHVGAYTR